ncbi:MAG: hypothetical protein SOH70_05110 [Lentilactobacillus sunkii]|uniref:hypothetical protein n=1 Tax=Lentilactobacillus sunkii TaxID=481719 RepID=UPI002F359C44
MEEVGDAMGYFEYLDWWRSARQARNWYLANHNRPADVELTMYNYGFLRGGWQPRAELHEYDDPGIEMGVHKITEIFIEEYNRQHHQHLTVDEFLK